MARKFYTNIDLTGFQIIGALMNPVSSDPAGLGTSDAGRLWFNSTSNRLKYWNGTAAVDPIDRSSHQGTQLASTISDLAATVKAYKLSEFAAPVADVSFGGFKLTNLGTPSAGTDATTKAYVDSAISTLTSGLVLKGSVRVATSTNVSLATPGATIDGITMSSGDVIMLMGQSTASQNGPWTWTGASSALTRPSNWASGSTATPGAFWDVREGSNADLFVLLTTDGTVTVDTTATAFVIRGSSTSGATSGYGTTVSGTQVNVNAGTGITVPASAGSSVAIDTTVVNRKVVSAVPTATSGAWTVSGSTATLNHALGTQAVDVVVRAAGTPYSGLVTGQQVEVDTVATDANNVQITLPAAPASGNWIVQVSA